jgi:hypothetical protein
MKNTIQIPEIPEEELTPTVKALLDIISQCVQIIESQKIEIQLLKDEIARLKGRSPKPKIKPSTLDKDLLEKKLRTRLTGKLNKKFDTDKEWEEFLMMVGIRSEKEIRVVTEAALMGSILPHGINKDIIILSDDAGQFEILILLHALCWLHAERRLTVVVPINDFQKKILDNIRGEIWTFYQELKAYKQSPAEEMRLQLENRFDRIFDQKTDFEDINNALHLIRKNKKELLLVLKRPEIPLHNNLSENSIRIYATKRKVHGGTRSESGRNCRDTFMSLKKTCRKLGISFQEYILDRLTGRNNIPALSRIITERM